jgi:hypothetical protein
MHSIVKTAQFVTDCNGLAVATAGPDPAKEGRALYSQRRTHTVVDDAKDCKEAEDRFTLKQRVMYLRDRWMGSLLPEVAFLLAVVALLIAGLGFALQRAQAKEDRLSLGEAFWWTWSYMADPGTHTDIEGTAARIVAAVIALSGIIYMSTVMGIVVETIHAAMEVLKKGKSPVVESGHYLILGWTDRCPCLIKELALACDDHGRGVVVVLAEQDKVCLSSRQPGALLCRAPPAVRPHSCPSAAPF